MLVCGFVALGGHRTDRDVHDGRVGPGHQVGEAGLFARLAQCDVDRVGLARVAVPAHVEPCLLPLVPAQQNPCAVGVHDQRRPGDVQRDRPAIRIVDGLEQFGDPGHVGRLGRVVGAVARQ
jgi:hypothetical protein